MNRCVVATATVLAALAMQACGGGERSTVAFADVKPCLKQAGEAAGFDATTDPDELDVVAADAGDGAMTLDSDKQGISVIVERSEGDAENTANAMKTMAKALFEVSFDDETLDVRGNVVISYDKTPTDDEKALVDDCVD